MTSKALTLVDQYGEPIKNVSDRQQVKAIERAWGSYVSALSGLEGSVTSRSRDPFGNHVWVYAAIMAIATNVSQVPLQVWQETPDDPSTGRKQRKLNYGKRRTACQRHLDQHGRKFGQQIRGVEPDYDDEISRLLYQPNPYQSGPEFLQLTAILQHTKGACFWLKTREDGELVGPNEDPAYMWASDPDLFAPQFFDGEFVGWSMALNFNDPSRGRNQIYYELVRPYQVVWHRFPNPEDPLGWMSPLAAAANGVAMDIAAMAYNRSVLRNGSKPGGILLHEDDIDETEEEKLRKHWAQKHEGPQNANKLAILTGNFKYIDTGLGPKDMDYLKQREWDRDEILGALGVTKSIMSITDGLNYSTQISQDKNFWDKKLWPMMNIWEKTSDKSLMGTRPDSKVVGFDFSRVAALKAGLAEAVGVVVQLTGPQIHMPPKQAFAVAGLDVPSYPGDTISLIPTSLASSIDVIAGKLLPTAGSDPKTGQPAAEGDDRQPRPADEEPKK